MRIRCERCSTVYELDEGRLPPQGAAVKCTRCEHVFQAVPPARSPASAEKAVPVTPSVETRVEKVPPAPEKVGARRRTGIPVPWIVAGGVLAALAGLAVFSLR